MEDFKYTWDNAGNLTHRQELVNSANETFTYDFLNRVLTGNYTYLPGDANADGVINMGDVTRVEMVILEATPPTLGCDANQDGQIDMGDIVTIERKILGLDPALYTTDTDTISYDAIGNITLKNGVSYTYNTTPHAVTSAGSGNYTYDANGNMTDRGGQSITWDLENRPINIGTSSFVYDGDGNRIKKTENGQITVYPDKYYEKNLSTGNVTTYYYLGDKLIAQKQDSVLKYIQQDSLGSNSLITDSSGSYAGAVNYHAYGSTRSQALLGSFPTDKMFTGQRLDSTGLYYYGARYYDPSIGRFISPDTVTPNLTNPQALNRYSYALNNPLKYTDPTGHWPSWGQVGSFFKGMGNAAVNTVKSTVQMVVNPVQTAQAIGYAVTHPVETFNAIKADYAAKATSAEGIGEITGEVLITIASLATGGAAAAKGVQAISKVAKAAGVIEKASILDLEVTNRVFWSGGQAAKCDAIANATLSGGKTLEMTSLGKKVEAFTQGMSWEGARPWWKAASQYYAETADGPVNFYKNVAHYTEDSIWATIEQPALMANKNVSAIIYNYSYYGVLPW